MRKGQVTIFIIIGLVLVLSVAMIFFFTSRMQESDTVVVTDSEKPLYSYVQSCLGDVAEDGIALIGLQGGYISVPEEHLKTEYSTVPYYYNTGRDTSPTKETIEDELNRFIENRLNTCLQDFSVFENQGYNITKGVVFSDVMIREEDVRVKITYPLTISNADSEIDLDTFIAVVPIRLGYVYDSASAITAKTLENSDLVDMTYLSEFDVNIEIIPHDNDELVYAITDEKSNSGEEPFVFLFAMKYEVNQPPIVNIPEGLRFREGEPVIFKVIAKDPEGDPMTFMDDSALFDITNEGVIIFNPEIPGEFDVTITVSDNHGNEVSRKVLFVVE